MHPSSFGLHMQHTGQLDKDQLFSLNNETLADTETTVLPWHAQQLVPHRPWPALKPEQP